VTDASRVRSFLKAKLLKNYLKSSISQKKLNDLAILCIKKDVVDHTNIDTIISDFV
jgi:hypothetical protein